MSAASPVRSCLTAIVLEQHDACSTSGCILICANVSLIVSCGLYLHNRFSLALVGLTLGHQMPW